MTRIRQHTSLKQPSNEFEPTGGDNLGESFEHSINLQCRTQQQDLNKNEDLSKSSEDIAQKIEISTSASDCQLQQISTNMNLEKLVECVMQESDLDQCASALEKDAALNGGSGFGDSANLIWDNIFDEIISSNTFNELLSNNMIDSDYVLNEVVGSDENIEMSSSIRKDEDTKYLLQNGDKEAHISLIQNQNNDLPPIFEKPQMKCRFPEDIKGNISLAAQHGKHLQHTSSNGQQQNLTTSTHHSYSQQKQQPSQIFKPQNQGSPICSSMGQAGKMGGATQHQQMSQRPSMGAIIQGGALGESKSNFGATVGFGGSLNMSGSNIELGNNGMGANQDMGHNTSMASDVASIEGMDPVSSGMCSAGSGDLPGNMGSIRTGMQHIRGMFHQNDGYPMSQKQTTNFSHQSLRRAGMPVPNISPSRPTISLASMGNQQHNMTNFHLPTNQTLNQQQQKEKLLRQHLYQKQYRAAAAARSPTPYCRTSTAGKIQGSTQLRYVPAGATSPSGMRNVGETHQWIPTLGPIAPSNLYLFQQQQQQYHPRQQIPQRANIYSQPFPMGVSMEPAQGHSQDPQWRHLMMTRPQNSGFNTMSPNFQQGVNITSDAMPQISALQHQQQVIRAGQPHQQGISPQYQQMVQQNNRGVQISALQHQQQGIRAGQPRQQGISPQYQQMVQQNNRGVQMAQMNNRYQAVCNIQQQQQQSMVQQEQQNEHIYFPSTQLQQAQSSVPNHSMHQQGNLADFNPQLDFNFDFLEDICKSN